MSPGETRLRGFLTLREEHDLQRFVLHELRHALVKIAQRIVRRLHDPLDVEAGLQERQHALPRAVHTPADDALQRDALEDHVARVVVDRDGMSGWKTEEGKEAA